MSDIQDINITVNTSKGPMKIRMFAGDTQVTCANFLSLAADGFYDGIVFHRVIPNFMIQGGDPTGTGMGDPNIPNIKDEFAHAGGNKNNRGTISMANAGPNTGSSQFFINLVDNNFLDGKHPTFGKVIEGMNVVDEIANVETGTGDRPIKEVVINKASVI